MNNTIGHLLISSGLGFLCLCARAVNHPEYPSVLQALEIEDPVVANCLIDQKGIESILLIKASCFTREEKSQEHDYLTC